MVQLSHIPDDLKPPDGFFKDVKYYVIGDIDSKVISLLNGGGAKKDSYLTDIITHVIAETSDSEDNDYSEAKELYELPVVTPNWVVLSVKCGVLLPTNAFNPEHNQLFSGVTACPSHLSEDDNKSVWGLITYHGGNFQLNLNSKATHLIVTKPAGEKYETALQHENITIVTPDWIFDSIKEKSQCDPLKYHPRLHIILKPKPPTPPTPPAPIQQAFTPPDEREQLGMHLPLTLPPGMHGTPTDGKPVAPKHMSPRGSGPGTPVGPGGFMYPGGPDTPTAKEALAKLVNNRIHAGKISETPEMPIPQPRSMIPLAPPPGAPLVPGISPSIPPGMSPSGMPSMESMGLGVSTPHGPPHIGERAQSPRGTLRNITNSGSGMAPNLTPTGRQPGSPGRHPGSPGRHRPNTPPRQSSQKINQILNQMGRSGSPRGRGSSPHPLHAPAIRGPPEPLYYGHDPSEAVPADLCLLGCVFYITDYQKLLEPDMITTWRKVIQQHGGEVDTTYSHRITHLLCDNQTSDIFKVAVKDQKRVVSAHWLNDCLQVKRMGPPGFALHFPTPHDVCSKPCGNQVISLTNFEGEERTRIKHMISIIGAKYTGYLTRENTVLISKRLEGVKYEKAREWKIPIVNVQWLNDLMFNQLDALKLPVAPKYQQFNLHDAFRIQEPWRVAHLLEGWRVPLKIPRDAWKKLSPSAIMKQQQGKRKAEETHHQPVAKKLKLEGGLPNTGTSSPKVLITGVSKRKVAELERRVESLGGTIVTTAKQCSHLVTNQVSRTIKFLTAMPICRHLVTSEWINESFSADRFIDESNFVLKDAKVEQDLKFDIAEALKRAKQKPLFKDMTFYLTPSVMPGVAPLKEMIENAGGLVVPRRPRAKVVQGQKNSKGEPVFIVITCENDLHLCRDLFQKKVPVFNAEFVLTGIIRQKIEYEVFRVHFAKKTTDTVKTL